MNTAVVITTKNESPTIGSLVAAFRARGMSVYVVDDGSGDDTVLVATRAGAWVIDTGGSLGIGPSLMRGWRKALAVPTCDRILQIDAGGSHQAEDYDMLSLTMDGPLASDMVIGSRFMPCASYLGANGTTWWRPWASKLANLLCNIAHGSRYTDWTSGYRLFSRNAAEYLLTRHYQARMHGWQIEVLAYASEHGFRIAEAPIVYVAGRSSFNARVAREALSVWWHVLTNVGWKNSKLFEETA